MNIFKLLLITAATLPATVFSAGPTPPQPGDLPPWVLTAAGDWTIVDVPGGGHWVAHHPTGNRQYNSPDGTILNCNTPEELKKCKDAMAEDWEDEDPPAEDPPAEDPPTENPPKDPPPETPPTQNPPAETPPTTTKNESSIDPAGCDAYSKTTSGEICMIAEGRYISGALADGFSWVCPTGNGCFFSDFFHLKDKENPSYKPFSDENMLSILIDIKKAFVQK